MIAKFYFYSYSNKNKCQLLHLSLANKQFFCAGLILVPRSLVCISENSKQNRASGSGFHFWTEP